MGKQRNSSPYEVADQVSEVDSSGHRNDLESPTAAGIDVFLHDLSEYLTYRAIYDLVNPCEDVVCFQLMFDGECPSNMCYVVFATAAEARSALQVVGSFNISGFRAEQCDRV